MGDVSVSFIRALLNVANSVAVSVISFMRGWLFPTISFGGVDEDPGLYVATRDFPRRSAAGYISWPLGNMA